MAETKRRNRSAESSEGDSFGHDAPRRQTRVTLTKDVSSKYRKIMPKAQGSKSGPGRSGGFNKRTAEGQEGGSRPPARGQGFKRSEGGPGEGGGRPRTAGSGPGRPGGARPGSGRPAAGKPGFGRPASGGSGGGKPGFSRPGSGGFGGGKPGFSRSGPGRPGLRRGAPKGPPVGGRGRFDDLEMKAISSRELPEASRQLKEAQDLIFTSANEILALLENLEKNQQALSRNVDEALARHGALLEPVLSPLKDELQNAQQILRTLFTKMSFQDLAGQRLYKVENFCSALSRILEKSHSARPPEGRPFKKDFKKPGQAPERRKPEGRRALKGPQAPGEGLDQNDIDRLLADT